LGFENPEGGFVGRNSGNRQLSRKERASIEELQKDIEKVLTLVPGNIDESSCHLWRFRRTIRDSRSNRTKTFFNIGWIGPKE
jgi:L-rhamnose isomerase